MRVYFTFYLLVFLLPLHAKTDGLKPEFAISDTLNDQELVDLFTYIMEGDRSYLKQPQLRQRIFVSNFNLIIEVIKIQGFPVLSPEYKGKRGYMIFRGTTQTFLHILQAKPDLMLNHEMIAFLETELESKRLPQLIMDIAVYNVTQPDMNGYYTSETEAMLDFAIKEWNISTPASVKEQKSKNKQAKN